MGNTEVKMNDYDLVRKALNLYVEAGRQGKASIMKDAFHQQAIMYGHQNGNLVGGPIQNLFDYIDENPPAENLKAEITQIDIAGQIAQAKVESDNWNGSSRED